MREFIHRFSDFPVGSSIPDFAFMEGRIVAAISSIEAHMQDGVTVPRLHSQAELTSKSSASPGACPKNLIPSGPFSK
jgi:hypothetical protein